MIKYSIIILFILSCGSKKSQDIVEENTDKAIISGYDFDHPSETLVLPSELSEISGLDYQKEEDSFIAINDEKGTVYELRNGQVINKTKFAKAGDYEGIARTPKGIFVARHDGVLFLLDGTKSARKIKTALNKSNDVEGLCYLPELNGLLVACKGQSKIRTSSRLNPARSIFFFNLETEKLINEPFIEVNNQKLQEKCLADYTSLFEGKLDRVVMAKRIRDFAPSGIAIHPTSNNYYILSSRGRMLVVMDSNKEILKIHFLDESMHIQPEGISFSSNGDLYISNEGKQLTSKLFKYTFHR